MITIKRYTHFPDQTLGLGQDVSHDLTNIVKVAALFVKNSKICKDLQGDENNEGRLKKVTLDAGAPMDVYRELLGALEKEKLTKKQLVSLKNLGRKPYASGLIRAIFKGQRSVAIVDWAAQNYLSVAIGMGLVDLCYSDNYYFLTKFGKKAVELFDDGKTEELKDFMLNRLYEYPYAAWLIRLVNKNPSKSYTKFDLGENFGFIDEPGFISLPEDLYVDGILQAKSQNDVAEVKRIRENFESTSDKYMRWLAGVLVNYDLLKETKKTYSKKIGAKKYSVSLQAYKITYKGMQALNKVNGGSKYSRSKKRVRWEYLAPKVDNAKKRKTSRALILKFLSEAPEGIDNVSLSNKINKIEPSINSISEQVSDDIEGLNRLGIEIDIKGNKFVLKDKLFDFIIPVKKNFTFTSSCADKVKKTILPALKKLDHKYLQAVDIAYKKKTTNTENTLLEILSTDLFVKEMNFNGFHLGGSNKPDGFAYTKDKKIGLILDSKAYSSGFAVTKSSTDAMARYIRQYNKRNDNSKWWINIPKDIKNTYFLYISSYYIGNYSKQLIDFEHGNEMEGGLAEIAKLILVAEKVKENFLNEEKATKNLLNDKISMAEYYEDLK